MSWPSLCSIVLHTRKAVLVRGNRSLLSRNTALCAQDYLKLATAGAACNALVRLVLHPLDCVKTTVQAEMGRGVVGEEDAGGGWVSTVKGILNKGGVGELLRGIDVSTVRPGPTAVCLVPCMSSIYTARRLVV